MTTAYVCNGKTDAETVGHLLEFFETCQLNPKYLVGDQGFKGTELEAFYNRKNIRPITLGPGTPWPNRAEAAVRVYKKQIALMLKAVTEDPSRYEITYRQLLRQASLAETQWLLLVEYLHCLVMLQCIWSSVVPLARTLGPLSPLLLQTCF